MSNIKTFLILILLLVNGAVVANAQNLDKIYQIDELNADNPADGEYYIEGYIARVYKCPSCPKGAMCKACMMPNVVISKDKKQISNYSDVTNDDLIVYTGYDENFSVGQKYRFLIKIENYSNDSDTHEVKLVKYEALKD